MWRKLYTEKRENTIMKVKYNKDRTKYNNGYKCKNELCQNMFTQNSLKILNITCGMDIHTSLEA